MAATETLLQGATEIIRHVNASYTAGAGTLVIDSAVTDHGGSAVAVPYEILVGRNRPPAERRFFVVTAGAGTSLTIAASPGYTDDQNYVAGDQVDLISAWETQRRLRAFATLHTHTGGVDGATLPAPEAVVTRTIVQSITNGAWNILAFDSERLDNDTIHDTATNNSRLTCKTAGRYYIWGTAAFANNLNNTRILMLTKNSGGVAGAGTILQEDTKATASGVSGFHTALSVGRIAPLVVNDYVELHVFQDSGGALNINQTAEYTPEFGMRWLGP